MKKIIFLTLFISALVLSCKSVQNYAQELSRKLIEENRPDITVRSAKIKNMTLSDITLECVLDIKNNLPEEMPIEKIEIELINTDGKTFATANSVESLKIPANETRAKTVILNAKYFEVYSTALTSLRNRELKCTAKTYITFTMARMKFRFPYTVEIVFIQ